ncbi:unnamed protein product [Meloidogyne enterolobii]|uniref:Uncharacterized protein n=1 Tax=Meloidogyne enterolobii TaxID=390850 RepID=A0ACB0XZA6_MELEN
MRLDRILIILIVNAIFWSLINSVKNNKDKNELNRVGETSKDNDGAESSVNPQIHMLKPKPKITKKGTTKDNKEGKKLNKSEYYRRYRQNNKEKRKEAERKYREKNGEKRRESARNYYKNNKEKRREYLRNNKIRRRECKKKYRENNLEKIREYERKYREKRKNKKENLTYPKILRRVDSDNNGGGTSNPQNDNFRNKDNLPVVYEEGIRSEEGNNINREEEETETYVDDQNQHVVEEPNNIPEKCINQINLNEYPFDLNEKPEDNE